jgi:RecJ-like exonuclease
MSDISCAKCGEPWDAYGVKNGDMTDGESRRFLAGEGCPSCNFGTECPSCSGMGKRSEYYERDQCCRNGRILVWSPNRSSYTYSCENWYTGYVPKVKTLPGDIKILRNLPGHMTNEGRVREAWAECQTCHGEGKHLETCNRCKGTGKLEEPTLEQESKFMGEALESTDDPDTLLNSWRK